MGGQQFRDQLAFATDVLFGRVVDTRATISRIFAFARGLWNLVDMIERRFARALFVLNDSTE